MPLRVLRFRCYSGLTKHTDRILTEKCFVVCFSNLEDGKVRLIFKATTEDCRRYTLWCTGERKYHKKSINGIATIYLRNYSVECRNISSNRL